MIEKLILRLSQALAIVAGIALLLMMVQTVVDVTLNNVMGAPIEGNLEVMSVYHMVAIVFLPLALVEMKHEHINVDLLVRLFPRGLTRLVNVLGYVVSTIFFAMLTYQTAIDAWKSYKIDEILMTSILITIWPAKFSLPIGFAAVTLACGLHAWQCATDANFEPVPESPDLPADPS